MVLDTFLRVASSMASCLFWHRPERPGTALRTLCVVAFDFLARAGGQRLGREHRRALSCLLDLGALVNDHFDQQRFCKGSYRKLRKQLAANETVRTVYRAYFRALRQAERNRPRLWLPCREGIPKEAADYRETVVRISLSALAAIAFSQPGGDARDDSRNSPAEEACLSRLFGLVMLIQICDDLLDWRRDWRAGLPTFATAELLECAGQAAGGGTDFGRIRANVETAAATYLAADSQRQCAFWPFAPACTPSFSSSNCSALLPSAGVHNRRRSAQPALSPAGQSSLLNHRKIEHPCDFPGRSRSDRTNRPMSAASASVCRT